MNALETKNLTKSYRGKVVLDGVSVCVREGEIYGLVGRNGSGKTTLIRSILGLASPDSGEIRINGAVSRKALEYERKKIGSIIDSPAIALHMSALDNMKSIALASGHCDVKKLKTLLERVGLNPDDPMKAKNFSLGMKQRLAIAIALIGDPRILILDEPVNGLDPAGIFEVRELLQRLNHTEHLTILISSHLLSELGKVANSYGILEGGKLVKELRSSDLDELCKPYIKVVVGDLKTALRVVVENYKPHEFEILPYNTLALYDLSKDIPFVATMFANANVPVLNIYKCDGDLESTFIALMGGLHGGEDQDAPVFEELGDADATKSLNTTKNESDADVARPAEDDEKTGSEQSEAENPTSKQNIADTSESERDIATPTSQNKAPANKQNDGDAFPAEDGAQKEAENEK